MDNHELPAVWTTLAAVAAKFLRGSRCESLEQICERLTELLSNEGRGRPPRTQSDGRETLDK
jgi:hypothetical protein